MNSKSRRNTHKKTRRSSRKQRGGSSELFEDRNLDRAYRVVYEYVGNENEPYTSYHLNKYLEENKGNPDDNYEKIKEINDMLIKGYKMMKNGYDKFDELMTSN